MHQVARFIAIVLDRARYAGSKQHDAGRGLPLSMQLDSLVVEWRGRSHAAPIA
jgi:hypothetical protein